MRTIIGTILAMGVCAVHADAPSEGPDWSSDRFLLGKWSCDLDRPGHERAHESASYSLGLAERWLKLTYTMTMQDQRKPPVTTEAFESYEFTEAVEIPAKGRDWSQVSFLHCRKAD